jgi:carboxylate-amine ligase
VSEAPALHLFDAFGIELEYMIVDAASLAVLPAAGKLLAAAAGRAASGVERGAISWSNELVLHVIELKTTRPEASLEGLALRFAAEVRHAGALLAPLGGRLMPSGMHPFMDPSRETRLWPHDHGEVYAAFDRIFDCRGHGWSNLQSVHLNLPFADDAEFGRLHAAVRLLLPILPALAASSPLAGGRLTGTLDTRLDFYRANCRRIPSVTGRVIPEAVFSRRDYEDRILERIYRDLAPLDPEGILREEWVNARGAIPRFDRGSIEIRVMDVQECPRADLAVISAAVAVLSALAGERWAALAELQSFEVEPLEEVFLAVLRQGDTAMIRDPRYLAVFGLERPRATAGELWRHLLDELLPDAAGTAQGEALRTILERGPLARRIVEALEGDISPERIALVYRRLCDCLDSGELFLGLA